VGEIQILAGPEARSIVDPLYERNGKRPCARDEDLFFIAIEDGKPVGCVRFCVENGTPMLRTMMVDSEHRRRGIGSLLLQAFAAYLDANRIRNVFCLPYAHLDVFYGSAGFECVVPNEAPLFLQERMHSYDPSGTAYLCMRRP
jgi:N-acetylglutamate synthase-like GNAT family acetyltransferase